MWLFRLSYLGLDPNYTNAAAIYGAFEAFVPLSIIAGSILLFATMETTGCLDWVLMRLKRITKVCNFCLPLN